MSTLLLATIFLPAAAALVLLLLDVRATVARARTVALLASVGTLLMAVQIAAQFQQLPPPSGSIAPSSADAAASSVSQAGPIQPRFAWRQEWLSFRSTNTGGQSAPVRLEFFLGLDGISVAMVLMTALVTVCAVLASWMSVKVRPAEFFAHLLILETSLLGIVCSFDVILFYSFFELALLPMVVLTGLWGTGDRAAAAVQYLIYMLVGSLLTLVGLAWIVSTAAAGGLANPCSLPDLAFYLQQHPLPANTQFWLLLLIAAGFVVKVPFVPFHTWLPALQVAAPPAAAALLLKVGVIGFARLCLPLLPSACLEWGLPLVAMLAVIGIVYGSFGALAQSDLKQLVAYSSIAHVAVCMLGLFALNVVGMSGGLFQMVNLGVSTAGLFLLIGMLEQRYGTRNLLDLQGLASKLPLWSTLLVFFTFASIGLPGLNGFVGEFLSFVGMFTRDPIYGALAATGVVLGAWYMLRAVQHVCFGPLKEPARIDQGELPLDLGGRELAALVPLAIVCVVLGLFPQPLLKLIEPDVTALAHHYDDRHVGQTTFAQVLPVSAPQSNPSPLNANQP